MSENLEIQLPLTFLSHVRVGLGASIDHSQPGPGGRATFPVTVVVNGTDVGGSGRR